jgi:septal ring-binding cell division protein DamX
MMKKVILVLASLAILIGVSCREQESKTVIIEKQVEAPKEKESNGTSISIDKDGVEFSTKTDDN